MSANDNSGIFKTMIQSLPDVLYELNKEGNFVFISEGIKLFGYDPEELIGVHFSFIIHPEDRRSVDRQFVLPLYEGVNTGDERAPKLFNERRTKQRMTKNLEVRLMLKKVGKGGDDFNYVEVHSAGVWDVNSNSGEKEFVGVVGIFRNIGHRKSVENILKEREENLLNIINNDKDAIMILSNANNVLFVNRAMEDIVGMKEKDILNNNFSFPIEKGESGQIQVTDNSGNSRIYETITSHIKWHGMDALLISMRDQTEQTKLKDVLIEYSMTDDLTGLYNRRGFTTLGKHQLKVAKRDKKDICILFIDVDKLKTINDMFGHINGDLALLEAASAIKRSFRDADIIGRIGGDEFAVFAPISDENNARIFINRLNTCLDIINIKKELPFKLSVSVGVVTCHPDDVGEISELLSSADKLMYEDKKKKQDK